MKTRVYVYRHHLGASGAARLNEPAEIRVSARTRRAADRKAAAAGASGYCGRCECDEYSCSYAINTDGSREYNPE